MESEARIRIEPDGSFRLPGKVLEKLGWRTGSYLDVSIEEGMLRVKKVEVDPFEEALKKPQADAFEKVLKQQKKSQEEALKTFEERVKEKDFPQVRPEDKPDYWR